MHATIMGLPAALMCRVKINIPFLSSPSYFAFLAKKKWTSSDNLRRISCIEHTYVVYVESEYSRESIDTQRQRDKTDFFQ